MFFVQNHTDSSKNFSSPLSAPCLWLLDGLRSLYRGPDVAFSRGLVITDLGKPRFSFACSPDEFLNPLRRFKENAEKLGLSVSDFSPSFITIERLKNRLFWRYQIGTKPFWLTLDGRPYHLSDGCAFARMPQQVLSLIN